MHGESNIKFKLYMLSLSFNEGFSSSNAYGSRVEVYDSRVKQQRMQRKRNTEKRFNIHSGYV
jgi:hypothetical protein